jgi:toxin ParE1/3/4
VVEIAWTNEAERWLEDIFEYIAAEDPNAASRVVSGIYERAQILKVFPEVGYRYAGSDREVRILLYGHYRIAYLIESGGNVDILGVFHGALDISKYVL